MVGSQDAQVHKAAPLLPGTGGGATAPALVPEGSMGLGLVPQVTDIVSLCLGEVPCVGASEAGWCWGFGCDG